MNLRGWARLSQMMWSPLLGDPDGEDTSLTHGSLTKASPLAAGPVTSLCLLCWLVLGQTHPPSLCSRPLVWGSFEKLENGWLEETEGHVAHTLKKEGLGQRPATELAREAYAQMEQDPHMGQGSGAQSLGSEISSLEPSDDSMPAVCTGLPSMLPAVAMTGAVLAR